MEKIADVLAVHFIIICLQGQKKSPTLLIIQQTDIPLISLSNKPSKNQHNSIYYTNIII
jgi:hypothetical protein